MTAAEDGKEPGDAVGEERWGRAGLLGASAMLIREEHECRPKAKTLSPFYNGQEHLIKS